MAIQHLCDICSKPAVEPKTQRFYIAKNKYAELAVKFFSQEESKKQKNHSDSESDFLSMTTFSSMFMHTSLSDSSKVELCNDCYAGLVSKLLATLQLPQEV